MFISPLAKINKHQRMNVRASSFDLRESTVYNSLSDKTSPYRTLLHCLTHILGLKPDYYFLFFFLDHVMGTNSGRLEIRDCHNSEQGNTRDTAAISFNCEPDTGKRSAASLDEGNEVEPASRGHAVKLTVDKHFAKIKKRRNT